MASECRWAKRANEVKKRDKCWGTDVLQGSRRKVGRVSLWLWHIPAPGRKSRAETGRPWGWVTRKETASILKPTAAEQWKPCAAIFVWLQQLIEPGGAGSVRCLPSISLTKRGTLFPCQKPVSLSCLRMIKMPLCSFMRLSQKEFIARQKDSNWKMARALLLLSFHCWSANSDVLGTSAGRRTGKDEQEAFSSRCPGQLQSCFLLLYFHFSITFPQNNDLFRKSCSYH